MTKIVASGIWPQHVFGHSDGLRDPDDLRADRYKLLIINGGEDISPSIYGEKPLASHAGPEPSQRDQIEMDLIKKAWEIGIPVLGICRGAQLLCAMTGGKLYQDVSGHAGGNHTIYSKLKGWEFGVTNSCHHQMMIPTEEGELLAWTDPLVLWKKSYGSVYTVEQMIREAGATGRLTRFKVDKRVVEDIKEPEVVLWKERRSLGVQGHPEWLRPHDWLVRFTQHILNDLGVA